MSPSLTTFLFEAANFVTLAVLLGWLFFKPVRKALEDQRAKDLAQAVLTAQKLAEAERMRAEWEKKRQRLEAELEQMRSEARDMAQKEVEKILAEGRAQIEQERAAVRREVISLEKTQTIKIARAVAGVTHQVMLRFLQQIEGPELEWILLKAACRELQTLSHESLAPVTIESATPLDINQKQLIESALGPATTTAKFRVVPELVAGARISTGHGLVDASVAGLANFAEQYLAKAMETLIREESTSA